MRGATGRRETVRAPARTASPAPRHRRTSVRSRGARWLNRSSGTTRYPASSRWVRTCLQTFPRSGVHSANSTAGFGVVPAPPGVCIRRTAAASRSRRPDLARFRCTRPATSRPAAGRRTLQSPRSPGAAERTDSRRGSVSTWDGFPTAAHSRSTTKMRPLALSSPPAWRRNASSSSRQYLDWR